MQRYRDTRMESPKNLEGLKDGAIKNKWNRRLSKKKKLKRRTELEGRS